MRASKRRSAGSAAINQCVQPAALGSLIYRLVQRHDDLAATLPLVARRPRDRDPAGCRSGRRPGGCSCDSRPNARFRPLRPVARRGASGRHQMAQWSKRGKPQFTAANHPRGRHQAALFVEDADMQRVAIVGIDLELRRIVLGRQEVSLVAVDLVAQAITLVDQRWIAVEDEARGSMATATQQDTDPVSGLGRIHARLANCLGHRDQSCQRRPMRAVRPFCGMVACRCFADDAGSAYSSSNTLFTDAEQLPRRARLAAGLSG